MRIAETKPLFAWDCLEDSPALSDHPRAVGRRSRWEAFGVLTASPGQGPQRLSGARVVGRATADGAAAASDNQSRSDQMPYSERETRHRPFRGPDDPSQRDRPSSVRNRASDFASNERKASPAISVSRFATRMECCRAAGRWWRCARPLRTCARHSLTIAPAKDQWQNQWPFWNRVAFVSLISQQVRPETFGATRFALETTHGLAATRPIGQ